IVLERGLEGRDQLLKLVKRHAREIQELHRAGLQRGEPYTCHGSCLLSLYGDVRGASYQKESGINSIALPADVIPRTLEKLAQFPPGGTNSMQRDLMSGRPSELEAHAGAVVRLGQALGVPTPVNTFLYHSLLPLELQARGRLVFPS